MPLILPSARSLTFEEHASQANGQQEHEILTSLQQEAGWVHVIQRITNGTQKRGTFIRQRRELTYHH